MIFHENHVPVPDFNAQNVQSVPLEINFLNLNSQTFIFKNS